MLTVLYNTCLFTVEEAPCPQRGSSIPPISPQGVLWVQTLFTGEQTAT